MLGADELVVDGRLELEVLARRPCITSPKQTYERDNRHKSDEKRTGSLRRHGHDSPAPEVVRPRVAQPGSSLDQPLRSGEPPTPT